MAAKKLRYAQRCKNLFHALQAVLIFITACITIAVFTKDGGTGGPTRWYFAVCFLTIPALVYLVGVPMWPRAERLLNWWALCAVDVLYTIFWFTAFIAVAMWNASGIRKGAAAVKAAENEGNCTTFAYGSESKCNLSRATVGLGIVIFIVFILTSAISAFLLIQSRKPDFNKPDQESTQGQKGHEWSADTRELDHPDEGNDDGTRTEEGGQQEEDEHALLNDTDTEYGRHPGRPVSWGSYDQGSGYNPVGRDRYGSQDLGYSSQDSPYEEHHPDALSPTGYDEYRQSGYNGYDRR